MSIIFKNAGFKNTEEGIKQAFKRMVEGEVFRLGESKLYFTGATSSDNVKYSFVRSVGQAIWYISDMDLAQLSEWEVEVDWRENIEDGVWCKIRDCDLSRLHPELIKKYKDFNANSCHRICSWNPVYYRREKKR